MSVRDVIQAAAGAGGGDKLYVEDVFSTTLYVGNGSTQSINNGINLSEKGGLVWIKNRFGGGSSADRHLLFDTNRGVNIEINSNSPAAETTLSNSVTAFNTNGFSLGTLSNVNTSTGRYVSWTFRKAPKFFDIVTYTGTGVARTISHNLGSVPGCILVKKRDSAGGVNGDWRVYHRSNTAQPETDYLSLNVQAETVDDNTIWNDTAPTSTVFSVGTNATVNENGGTYVAYLFAHNAGGFGENGTDDVISCGGFTTGSGGTATITLGWEPEVVILKGYSNTWNGNGTQWYINDNKRGMPAGTAQTARRYIRWGSTNEEQDSPGAAPTATGFTVNNWEGSSVNAIYIAIRRGPMKKPTAGTDVFYAELVGPTSTQETANVPWPPDLYHQYDTTFGGTSYSNEFFDRLRGMSWAGNPTPTNVGNPELASYSTAAETTAGAYGVLKADSRNITMGSGWGSYGRYLHSFWRRYPSVFDIVCYRGTGVNRTVSHNLGVAPEMMIVRVRSAPGGNWSTYHAALTATGVLFLNLNEAATTGNTNQWNATAPTASVFTVGTSSNVNTDGLNYVAYLFASLAGVSKVGSYTGNGSSQTINCGFSNGARYFMVKRTDSNGDWWVYDSYRGIITAADPTFRYNSSAASVTSADAVDPASSGIIVNQEATCSINGNGSSYIYLAFA